MKLFICDNCGCEVKGKKPSECPICRKKGVEFTETEKPEPDIIELESLAKYEKALKTLDEYEEGCEPQKAKYAFEE